MSTVMTAAPAAPVPAPIKSRLTVVETVYHQNGTDQPTSAYSSFCRTLVSQDEQPFAKQVKVTEDWRPLDLGWIEQAGMVVIRNESGVFKIVIPTDSEREVEMRKVVEVGFCTGSYEITPSVLIPPTESARFYPYELSQLRIRCRSGMAKCTVHLFPV